MSLFDGMDLDGAKAPDVVDANSEVKLRILSVKVDKDKNGLDYVMPLFEIVGDGFTQDFSHFLHVPNGDNKREMELKKFEKARFRMNEFLKAFDIDASRPGDPADDWPGQTGFAIVGVNETDEYGKQNYVKRFVAPK